MAQRMILDGLWCGQGMANMVRIFANSATNPKTNPPDWLCVFDFGSGGLSASKKVLGTTPPVAFIMQQLELQQKAGRTPRIDLMVISHQDRDHWLLLGELNVQIVQSGMKVEVGRMLLGGSNWRLSSKTAVNKFVARAKGYTWYDGEYSSYYNPKKPGEPIPVGDMTLRMLVTNVATNDSREDIERNCSSAVVLLQLGQGLSFILPGDSTWETFARLKDIMKSWPTSPLPHVYSASVPHHGALRTMNRKTSVVSPDLQDLIWFTNYTQPTSIYASAGINNTHSHPYRIVLETMGQYTHNQQFGARAIVAFNGSTDKFEQIPDVRQNIYTTVLNLLTPAMTANWIFNITPSTHDTDVQPFEAGVPAILSVPEFSEMEFAAQRAKAEMHDVTMGDTTMAVADFARSPVWSGQTVPYNGGAPAAATEFPPVPWPWSANPAPRVPAYYLPQATAGAARSERRRLPPPRRVQVGPTAVRPVVLSPSG